MDRSVPAESALIIPVPEAEPVVAAWRAQYDPVATRGVPAHITLLYPFVPPSHVDEQTDLLRRFFDDVSCFDFVLTEVRRFPETAYLHPEPAEPIIPHLTVADRCTTEVLDRVQRELTAKLPVTCRATEAWLLCSDQRGAWSVRERFSLRKPAR